MIDLTQGCMSIAELDASWVIKLTDLSLSYLAQNSKCLEKLYLSGCHQITDSGLTYLAQCPPLRFLDVSHNPDLREDGDGLKVLKMACPGIKIVQEDKEISKL